MSSSIAVGQPASAGPGPLAVGVLGQGGSFTTVAANATTADKVSLANGTSIDSVRHRFFVADTGNHRVLVYNLNTDNTFPDDIADSVLGQSSFTTKTIGTTASTMDSPVGVAYDATNNRLYVSDQFNYRVLVFDVSTISNGMAASIAIGQTSLTTKATGTTQSTFTKPWGVALGSGDRYLYVADNTNRRVLSFDTASLGMGMNASNVIGQANFTSSVTAVSQSNLVAPVGVAVDKANNRLYISEASNNRVSAFDLGALADGMNASFVIGQSTFTSNTAATTRQGLTSPSGVAVGGGKLYVMDSYSRAMVFSTASTANGPMAIDLFGQSEYTTNLANNGGLGAGTLAFASGISFDQTNYRLFIGDGNNNRVLIFNTATAGVTITGVVNPVFSFAITGRSTACNGQSSAGFQTASTATALDLGVLSSAGVNGAAQDLAVTSNAAGGFKVYLKTSSSTPNAFRTVGGLAIADVPGTVAVPGNAPVAGTEGFGFTSNDAATTFTSNKFAKLTNNNDIVVSGTSDKSACVGFAAATATTTAAGNYSVAIIYTAVPTF